MKRHLILAVDDRPEILASVTEMLDGKYRVIGVKDSMEVFGVIEKQTPSLFLLDIEMPMFDGYDVASLLRMDDRFKNTPIIFLTGKATKSDVLKAVESGGSDYIIKPVKKSVLLEKIHKFL